VVGRPASLVRRFALGKNFPNTIARVFKELLKLQSEPMSWRRRDGQSFRAVLEKIDAVALTPAATKKKRPRANAARAKIAGRDLIDAPPLNRVALSTTASDEVNVGARPTNMPNSLSVQMAARALS
jgi:hypothetical protein